MSKTCDRHQKVLKRSIYFILVTLVCQGVALAGPAVAKIITINPAGTGDYATIREAINASQDGDVVRLEPGIYTGDGNREISFQGKKIEVTGMYGPGQTIIDCQKKGRAFIFNSGEKWFSTKLTSITILNGLTDGDGGAILFENWSGASILNCVIENCYTRANGGAIASKEDSDIIITDCIIRNNTAEMAGGGVYRTLGDEMVLQNCVFEWNEAGSYGGGIASIKNGVLSIDNCKIRHNTAAENGGGIAAVTHLNIDIIKSSVNHNTAGGAGGGVAIIDNSEFSFVRMEDTTIGGENKAGSHGGGLALLNSGEVEIANCTVAYNTANLRGGGIAIMNSTTHKTVLITGTIIGGNVTYSSGGGVAHWGGWGELYVTKCDIVLNTAAQDGGGIACIESNDAYILDSIVRLNTAGWSGGGIACIDTKNEIDIMGCGIGLNTAGRNGGGVANDGSYVICDGNVIVGNTAGWNGGGVSWTNDFSGAITLCGIVYNKAALSGGGVYYNGGAYKQNITKIYKCTMGINSAGVDGGAIACEDVDSFEIEKCFVISCTAGSMGGAIRIKDSSIQASDCILYKNSAVSGGGIYGTGKGDATINACDIKNNHAVDTAGGGGGFGGGIALDDYLGEHTFSDSSITDNVAADAGGGIYINRSDDPDDLSFEINRCLISGNRANGVGFFSPPNSYLNGAGGGGGIFCRPTEGFIQNSAILENVATGAGGGIYFRGLGGNDMFIENCTIRKNSAYDRGGALFCMANKDGYVRMKNNIVWENNTASAPEPIFGIGALGDPFNLWFVIGNNDLQGGVPADSIGIVGGAMKTMAGGNISVDPVFVDDWHIDPVLSPCIDQGDSADVTSNEFDLDGDPRIRGAAVDMGADEAWPSPTPSPSWEVVFPTPPKFGPGGGKQAFDPPPPHDWYTPHEVPWWWPFKFIPTPGPDPAPHERDFQSEEFWMDVFAGQVEQVLGVAGRGELTTLDELFPELIAAGRDEPVYEDWYDRTDLGPDQYYEEERDAEPAGYDEYPEEWDRASTDYDDSMDDTTADGYLETDPPDPDREDQYGEEDTIR